MYRSSRDRSRDLGAIIQALHLNVIHLIASTMLSRLGHFKTAVIRTRVTRDVRFYLDNFRSTKVENFDTILDSSKTKRSTDSPLPFSANRHNGTFGTVIHEENTSVVKNKNRELDSKKPGEDRSNQGYETAYEAYDEGYEPDYEDRDVPYHLLRSAFRNPDGSFIRGNTSEEARLDPRTVEARVEQSTIRLPRVLAQTISQNILSRVAPAKLRQRALDIFVNLEKELIQKAPSLSLDADAHIAALFLQNYSHAIRVLRELKKRVGKDFSPDAVLDIGYGPATGMIALNEVMGDDFKPKVKDAYVVGRANKEMKKRAKILLSRQLCEVPDLKLGNSTAGDGSKAAGSNDSYVGPVDTSKIEIISKLRDSLASTKRYDLIIVNQSLLTRAHSFPRDVDMNLEMILGLLAPGGHLVLIERGNTLGFEIIARARQVMLRPESHKGERGRIPRPYIRGSTIKPQKLRHEDQIITEEHIKYEEELLAQLEAEELQELKEMEDLERLETMKKLEDRGETEKLEAIRLAIEQENEILDSEKILSEQELSVIEKDALKLQEANMKLQEGEISDFEADIINKHGQISDEDLKFEFEDDPDFELAPVEESAQSVPSTSKDVDYHLSVVAPCPHHGECPLQLGDPQFYKISNHKHRFNFCSFDQVVERPKYTMELKKGKLLSTTWDKRSHDGFGFDKIGKSDLQSLQGSGRPRGGNTESGNFSYLIMKRENNDEETIRHINSLRDHHHEKDISNDLPRVIEYPTRIKNNIKIKMCAPSGNIELWQVPKSLGKQTYHDARKVQQGDLWALGKKSIVVKNKFTAEKLELLKRMAVTSKNSVRKEKQKKNLKKFTSALIEDFEDPQEMFNELASDLEQSKKYRVKGNKADFDVDVREYDGK